MMKPELLAPARDAVYGREAINHGADAVYIGAPAYGARAAATNSIADIEQLTRYAHLYRARVFVTLNTALFDHELEQTVQMAHELYNVGVDALIIQDMGLLECSLPPIELHASTQCHNNSVEKVKFMESAGFARVILARETSLEQMQAIRSATQVELEAFVHGALCVSYSGQCYLSQYLTGRSGNRGACAQPCRSTYDLLDAKGRTLVQKSHLLSLKDFNASRHLKAMAEAGICSFKIEGRLKDLSYVKNITAYYRQLLDNMLSGSSKPSSGKCNFTFAPDPDRTFNRGYTDYFLVDRQPMASFATQKSLGKRIGTVTAISRNSITLSGNEPLTAGDGLCFLDADGALQGFSVNAVTGRTVVPNRMPPIQVGTQVWRNNDQQFERQLKGSTATRTIGVEMEFGTTPSGFSLKIIDEDGVEIMHAVDSMHIECEKPQQNSDTIQRQLSKLGGTPFVSTLSTDTTHGAYLLPASTLNRLRREAVALLSEERIRQFRPRPVSRTDGLLPYPHPEVDYSANVLNAKSEQFYLRHKCHVLERGLEQTGDYEGKPLMTTRYCLRYELGCCRLGKSKGHPSVDLKPDEPLFLHNNGRRFRLEFDCRNCQMLLYADPRSHTTPTKP